VVTVVAIFSSDMMRVVDICGVLTYSFDVTFTWPMT